MGDIMPRETRKKLKELRAQLYQVENYNVTTSYEEKWRKIRIVELSEDIEGVWTTLNEFKTEARKRV